MDRYKALKKFHDYQNEKRDYKKIRNPRDKHGYLVTKKQLNKIKFNKKIIKFWIKGWEYEDFLLMFGKKKMKMIRK